MYDGKGIIFLLILIAAILASLGFTAKGKMDSEHLYNGDEEVFNVFSGANSDEVYDDASDKEFSDLFFSSDSTDSTSKNALNGADSLLADSVVAVDSMALDSTARLKYFHYKQPDSYSTSVTEGYRSNLFIYPSKQYVQKSVEIDSTGQFVLITEKIAGQESKVMVKMPLDEYINKMTEAINKQGLEKLGRQYKLVEGKKDLGKLLTDITNIDIPLPSTSFLSIFGPPKISLKINGAVDIRGAWRSETTEGQTVSRLGNTRNEPDFSQQVQISVNGSIGDKLSINADWNTERTFEYENQLRLNYKGYDDEIIQSIEAGNVSLQTSPLVGGSEALFGVKAKFQFGPFTLTALASQKKGEIKEVSVSGGSEKQEFEIHAFSYSDNHYFLDQVYANTDEEHNFFNNYYGNPTAIETDSSRKYFVKELEVWRTASGIEEQDKQRRANAFIDLPSRPVGNSIDAKFKDIQQEQKPGLNMINTRFERLTEGVDYIYNRYAGFISFKTNIQKTDGIAVAYTIEGDGNGDKQYGEFIRDLEDSAVAVLKLIKPQNLQPGYRKAWKLKLRNIYPLGGRDINEEEFKLDIYYRVEGQEPQNDFNGVKLLPSFGFDKYDDSKNPKPDGAFDFMPKTIIPSTGEIIFPVLEPFGQQLPKDLPDSIAYQSIYDTTKTFAQQDRTKDKFLIKGSYSAATSSTFQIGFNVVENSVRVTLDGRELKSGVDYSVDYNIGQITIRNADALVPGANLKITYEQNDLFQLASKTLMGLRGIYEFSKKTKLGFSFLNLNQKSLSDKVRIGEEPLNNSIYGVDFNTSADLPFITTALDKLISTSTKSAFNLKSEFAYMNPDPNTKKSTIASDNGESIAYIDDFEGSKRTIPIGISYTTWKDLSVPNDLPVIGDLPREDQMDYKAKSFWFNILPSNVTTDLIWPNKQVSAKDRSVTVLDYIFRPDDRGMYNYNPNLNDPKRAWGGMMKGLSSSANNLIDEKIEAIEFWINIINAPEDAKLNIDLGLISEDVIPNNEYDTEDKNFNSIVDEGEDTGIDGVPSPQEPGYDATNNRDPAGDNFRLIQSNSKFVVYDDYYAVNGTEGNAALTDIGRFPDSEDLNGNITLDNLDSYFRYVIPLDTSKENNPFVAGGGAIITTPPNAGKKSRWYQFKIPLKDFKEKIGEPSFSLVEYIRLWVTGVDEEVHFQITEFNLVGNQWQKIVDPPRVTEDDTVLTVSNVNIEDNPDYYSPRGIVRERDRTQIDQNIFKNEQSLEMILNDLGDGEHREVVKYLVKGMDVFNYTKMKLFVHGDLDSSKGSISYYDTSDVNNYATDLYFRFGSDSTNYYEYIQPTKPRWKEISINFDDLTTIKEIRPVDTLNAVYRIPVPGKPGHFYGIRGNPSLTRVSFFAFGIANPKNKGEPFEKVSGNLWVNELRVLGANDTPGYALSMSSSINFADLFSVSANYRQTDPYFHKLSGRFGNRVDSKSWGVSGNLDVVKLIPVNLPGSNLKVNYSHTESESTPLYKPQTDVLVKKAAATSSNPDSLKEETQTVNVSDTWSVSNIKFRIPSKKWYIRDTFNGLVFSYNYNSSESRSPSVKASNSWLWNASGKYSVSFSNDNFFYPANIPIIGLIFQIFNDYKNLKFYFTPQKFDAGVTAKRNYSYNLSRNANVDPNVRRDFTAARNAGFSWRLTDGGLLNLSTNYSLNITSSLAHLLTDELGNPRDEKDIWYDIFHGNLFGKDNNYSQSFSLSSKPKMPSILELNKFLTLSASYSVSYSWRNDFSQPILGRSVGWGNRINGSMTVRVKSIMDPIFKLFKGESARSPDRPKRKSRFQKPKKGARNIDKQIENDDKANKQANSKADSLAKMNKPSIFNNVLGVMLNSIQYVLFDYDQFSFNFSQNNSAGHSGMRYFGTGFWNFWGGEQDPMNGPSRLYQLGFSTDPGPRAFGGTVSNNFSQKNNFTIKTSRPLWKGADLDVNWNVGWGYNESISLYVDSLSGEQIITNRYVTGNINRSFMSLPMLGASVGAVNELYDPNSPDPNGSLSDAFVKGMESIPLLSKLPFFRDIAQYIPRPNWRINWVGLEKLPILKSLFKRASLNHAYTSTYMEGWKINADGFEEVQTQKVSYGFAPLVGLNLTFAEMWGGNIKGTVKYSVKSNYDLGVATKSTTETFSRDVNFAFSFAKSGFELPLFGLSLKNDIEISISYTMGRNSVLIYDMGENFDEAGKPKDGNIRTTIEPRIRYVMSSRVTLAIFFRRTSVEPEGASRIPATTTNEAGLDVHISIQ